MHRNRSLIVLAICLTLALAACPKASVVRQAAVASQSASIAVQAFQQAEIQSFQAGQVSAEDHATIQGLLVQVGQIGKTLDASLRAANSDASALQLVTTAVNSIDSLNQQGLLHIKNKDIQVKWTIAMAGAKAALNSIAVMLEPAGGTQ